MTDIPVTTEGGKIFWRGVYTPPDFAIILRDQFAATTDWFAPTAHDFADQLTKALEAVDVY